MAHGTDSEEFRLISGARSGLKREFAFALKNQSDLSGSLGRTRGKKLQNRPFEEILESPSNKRLKNSDVKEESVVDVIEKENVEINLVESSNDVKVKEDSPKSTCMDDTELVLEKSPSLVTEVPETEEMEPVGMVVDGAKCGKDEAMEEIPVVVDENVEGQNALLGRSARRFTRSCLKPKEEPVSTSSGSTGLSEDASKNESVDKDDGRVSDVVSPLKTPSRLEMKMSKKIALHKLPFNVRELLDTGLLDGLPVKYIFRNPKVKGIQGVIKDRGILCYCAECEGRHVLSANEFEKHANSSNKHPSDHIYLENGKNLRAVLNACKNAPLETLEEIIRSEVSSVNEPQYDRCRACKEPLPASHTTQMKPFCEPCLVRRESLSSPSSVRAPKSRLPKSVSTPKSHSASAHVPSQTLKRGKITRKDVRLHKLVFDEDGLPDGTELAYYIRGQKMLEGYKKDHGIFCFHCESVISPSQFESHAGYAPRRKPYLNIYTSNGVSLHELSISLSKGRKLTNNYNDDLCTFCAEGGDVLCCDMCPRSFHQECLGLSDTPTDKWYCPYCVRMYEREKACEYNANALAAGRVAGVDPIEEITKRCIRIVETAGTEIGGCILCRIQAFSKSGFGPTTVIICDQCEKEYHIGCLKSHKMADLRELPEGTWFCSPDCSRIHKALEKLVVHDAEKLPNSLLTGIKKKQEEKNLDEGADIDVRWSVLSGKTSTPEDKLLLSKAVTIFHDQFDPIVDAKTGWDLIPSMVYGRGNKDQDYGGMYCAVLTVNSIVVSAGILRIFGQEIAEIPLVATTSDNQGKGYFQALFSCIERLLGFLNVKNIVLPSAEESKSIWTDKFGFTTMSHDQVKEYKDKYQMMIFQGTSMLQKPVPKCRIVTKPNESS